MLGHPLHTHVVERKCGGVDAFPDEPLHSDLSLLLLPEGRCRQHLLKSCNQLFRKHQFSNYVTHTSQTILERCARLKKLSRSALPKNLQNMILFLMQIHEKLCDERGRERKLPSSAAAAGKVEEWKSGGA